jgi:hypothetical protein
LDHSRSSDMAVNLCWFRNPDYGLHFQGRRQRSSQQFEMAHSHRFRSGIGMILAMVALVLGKPPIGRQTVMSGAPGNAVVKHRTTLLGP